MASEEGACRKHIHGSFPRSSRSISSSGSNGARRRGKWRARLGWRASYFMIGLRPIGRAAPPGSIASAGARWGGERPLRRSPRRPSLRPRTPARPPRGAPTSSSRPRRGSPSSSGSSAASRRTCIFFAKPCGSGTPRPRKAARPPLRGHRKNDRGRAARLSQGRRQHPAPLGAVSRAGYYRHFAPKAAKRDDADLRDLIQRIALDNRHYGYRRIAHELRRQGLLVNAKRVLRLTHEDNLLALRRRPFVPQTTMSRHGFDIAPNLTRGLKPTGLDQIWVADITYVRLAEAFVYLAVVLDAFSRRVVGWALAGHLEASLAIEALDMALGLRDPAPGSLIHHSDPRRPIRFDRLSCSPERAENRRQHEPARQPLRQRQGGKLHEDAQTGGGQRENLRRSRRRPPPDRRLHRRRLQRQAPPLCARLQAPGRVRSRSRPGHPQPNKQGRSPVTELGLSQLRGALQLA